MNSPSGYTGKLVVRIDEVHLFPAPWVNKTPQPQVLHMLPRACQTTGLVVDVQALHLAGENITQMQTLERSLRAGLGSWASTRGQVQPQDRFWEINSCIVQRLN
jgi:hypothetical protein